MLEASISEASIIKRIMDSIKDLVTDANFDCNSSGINLQAMDSSHVSLVALQLLADGFEHYRADRNMSLGINLGSLSKILKCAGNDDSITLRADDGNDHINFMFESKKQDRISNFNLKLIDIDSEHLGIPDTEYKTTVRMPSAEFQRIVRELQTIGDTVSISATKEGVKFAVAGDTGAGTIVCKQGSAADDKEEESVQIKMEEEVSLTFALRYLNSFAKATPLSSMVTLKLSPDVPLVVEYPITANDKDMGHIRFYLAPKIEEEGGEAAASAAAADDKKEAAVKDEE